MRQFIKVFAFLMLGLGLAAAPGYWTYVNFLSAKTVTDELVFDSEDSGGERDVRGEMSVYLTPEMNPLQILGRLDIAPTVGVTGGGMSELNVSAQSDGKQVWAATAAFSLNFELASGGAQFVTAGANLGTLHVSKAGDYIIHSRVNHATGMQVQRIALEVRKNAIDIRWGIFGLGIFLILGAVVLYRVAES